jgi:K+-transporting ATPase KdpF subunit
MYLKFTQTIVDILAQFIRKKIPVFLLGLLGFTLMIAPLVYAANGTVLSRGQAYSIALLGLVTLSLFIYLFVVIFQPEKF